MTNGQKMILCAVGALLIAGLVFSRPFMLVSVPAGIVGVLAGTALYRAHQDDETEDGGRKRGVGATIGGIGALMFAISAGANVLSESGLLAQPKSASATASSPRATATYSTDLTEASVANARARIEKATDWCRGMYEAYDPNGSGYRDCMKRRVPASDYRVVAEAASLSRAARRAEAMTKSVRYCEQFAHNRMLYGDCLKAEQELRGW